MADPVSGATAPAAVTPISFTEHPIDYVVAKAEAAIDYFTATPQPSAPSVAVNSGRVTVFSPELQAAIDRPAPGYVRDYR